jgi:hypothetical protein
MADSLHPDSDDCFHCPRCDQPCPVTYQTGAWLAPAAEPTPSGQDRPQRAGDLDASIQQALRRLDEAVAGDPDDLASLPADIERASVAVGGAGGCCRPKHRRSHCCGSPRLSVATTAQQGELGFTATVVSLPARGRPPRRPPAGPVLRM